MSVIKPNRFTAAHETYKNRLVKTLSGPFFQGRVEEGTRLKRYVIIHAVYGDRERRFMVGGWTLRIGTTKKTSTKLDFKKFLKLYEHAPALIPEKPDAIYTTMAERFVAQFNSVRSMSPDLARSLGRASIIRHPLDPEWALHVFQDGSKAKTFIDERRHAVLA